MRERVRALLIGGDEAGGWPREIGVAIARLGFGLSMALGHGLAKVPVSEQFIEGVARMGFPMPGAFAWAAALAELVGGLLLALGLLTRPAALVVLQTMLVAAFIRHGGDPFKKQEMALLYASASVIFLSIGSGRLGLDAWLRRKL